MSPFRFAGEHKTSELSVHPPDFGEAPLPACPIGTIILPIGQRAMPPSFGCA